MYVLGAQDGRTPLHYAASYGDSATAEMLLDRGASIDAVDEVSARQMPQPVVHMFGPCCGSWNADASGGFIFFCMRSAVL